MVLHQRLLLAAAGLAGAAGVMAAAGASHAASRNLAGIATICLAHGPALLAMALLATARRGVLIAAALLAAGTLIFAADLGVREALGSGIFPGAAPLGGGAMILGWLALIVVSILPSKT